MYFCLRVDTDYVPWDTPDAHDFGHGEPALVLRLLDLGRASGYKFHFFASARNLRAFPSTADAILNDGHDLDWLCKHPGEDRGRFAEANELFRGIGHSLWGLGVKDTWPSGETTFPGLESLRFLSAVTGPHPPGLRFFPVETRTARQAVRAGVSARAWTDSAKTQVREAASRRKGMTLVVRPQVLARFDPKLAHLQEILDLANAVGVPPKSLRDILREADPTPLSQAGQ